MSKFVTLNDYQASIVSKNATWRCTFVLLFSVP